MPPVSSCRRLAIALAAALAAATTTAGPALASEPAPGCPAVASSNPFSQWGDVAGYELAPGGNVEDSGASWSLTGGAAAQEGNESFMVGAAADHLSMRLPGSSSAMTARKCIGVEHPSFRFFVKRTGGSSLSRLVVEVVADAWGRERSLVVGLVSGSSSWAPSAPLPTIVNMLAPLNANTFDVSFRFRAIGDAVWSIDDVYVDPWRTH